MVWSFCFLHYESLCLLTGNCWHIRLIFSTHFTLYIYCLLFLPFSHFSLKVIYSDSVLEWGVYSCLLTFIDFLNILIFIPCSQILWHTLMAFWFSFKTYFASRFVEVYVTNKNCIYLSGTTWLFKRCKMWWFNIHVHCKMIASIS